MRRGVTGASPAPPRRRLVTAAVLAGSLVGGTVGIAAPAGAIEEMAIGAYDVVRIEPQPGTALRFRNRTYRGTFEIRAASDGMVIVEHIDLDGYLAGIQEVPFSWHPDALAAQAVAARSYLASTLAGGRRGSAATYGFDICATTACQVYAGTGLLDGPDGDRWGDAVARTSQQVLVYEGRAAQTFYHSTSGGRTEAIQDVWAGSARVPYLQGAPSPNESSPFVEWDVSIPVDAMVRILAAADIDVGGDIEVAQVIPRPSGEGVWHVLFVGPAKRTAVEVGDLRAIVNRHGPALYPDLLPARRSAGRRYPQSILSYRYDVEVTEPRRAVSDAVARLVPDDDLPPERAVVFHGRGWGHHIGMSQYGAQALAVAGQDYGSILAHYYGGLEPIAAPELLPDEVVVGLDWGEDRFTLVGLGGFRVVADGRVLANSGPAAWGFVTDEDGAIALIPPARRLLGLTDPPGLGSGLL